MTPLEISSDDDDDIIDLEDVIDLTEIVEAPEHSPQAATGANAYASQQSAALDTSSDYDSLLDGDDMDLQDFSSFSAALAQKSAEFNTSLSDSSDTENKAEPKEINTENDLLDLLDEDDDILDLDDLDITDLAPLPDPNNSNEQSILDTDGTDINSTTHSDDKKELVVDDSIFDDLEKADKLNKEKNEYVL